MSGEKKNLEIGFGHLAAGAGCIAGLLSIPLWGPMWLCDGTVETACNAMGEREALGIQAGVGGMAAGSLMLTGVFTIIGKRGQILFNNL